MEQNNLEVDIGSKRLEWEVDEFLKHDRTARWYWVAGSVGIALIIYAIATANFLFAVIILMVGVITLLSMFVSPRRIPIIITNTGIVVDDTFYGFDSIKTFSIAYDPPEVKWLYVQFQSAWHPMLAIPLEEINPNEARDCLLPYCSENLENTKERLTDTVRRLYKL
jgi:hypothetical protein